MTDKLREEIIDILIDCADDDRFLWETNALGRLLGMVERERRDAAREAVRAAILNIERQWP